MSEDLQKLRHGLPSCIVGTFCTFFQEEIRLESFGYNFFGSNPIYLCSSRLPGRKGDCARLLLQPAMICKAM